MEPDNPKLTLDQACTAFALLYSFHNNAYMPGEKEFLKQLIEQTDVTEDQLLEVSGAVLVPGGRFLAMYTLLKHHYTNQMRGTPQQTGL